MSYIYKITNILNDKVYIGKTNLTPEERFIEHIYESRRERSQETSRPLYRAMNKYGVKNFKVDTIEECSVEDSSKREKFWIEYYHSFKDGYNATVGGDGTIYLDYDLIIKTYKETGNMNDTAKLCNCNRDSVKNVLKLYKIPIKTCEEVNKIKFGKPIAKLDKITEEVLEVFPSGEAAKRAGYEHAANVANGKRKTAGGFKWKWI